MILPAAHRMRLQEIPRFFGALITTISGRLRRLPRPESSAAIASAIAAGLSAYAAIHTFSYLNRQEALARQQLEATYLSNLYSKQVDALAALGAAVFEFYSITFTGPSNMRLCATDIKSCQLYFKENEGKIKDAGSKIATITNTLFLLMPDRAIVQSLYYAKDAVEGRFLVDETGAIQAIEGFVSHDVTLESAEKFTRSMEDNKRVLQSFEIDTCIETSLAKGRPFTLDTKCDYTPAGRPY